MYSILVGDGAIYNPISGADNVEVIFSVTYASTPTMLDKCSPYPFHLCAGGHTAVSACGSS